MSAVPSLFATLTYHVPCVVHVYATWLACGRILFWGEGDRYGVKPVFILLFSSRRVGFPDWDEKMLKGGCVGIEFGWMKESCLFLFSIFPPSFFFLSFLLSHFLFPRFKKNFFFFFSCSTSFLFRPIGEKEKKKQISLRGRKGCLLLEHAGIDHWFHGSPSHVRIYET